MMRLRAAAWCGRGWFFRSQHFSFAPLRPDAAGVTASTKTLLLRHGGPGTIRTCNAQRAADLQSAGLTNFHYQSMFGVDDGIRTHIALLEGQVS